MERKRKLRKKTELRGSEKQIKNVSSGAPECGMLLKLHPIEHRDISISSEHLCHPFYQEAADLGSDGTAGFSTKALYRALVKAMLPNWNRIFVTIQFQGKPRLETAQKVLHLASQLRDRRMLGGRYTRPSMAQQRTIDWYFPEEGSGENSGNLHVHGVVLINPTHRYLGSIEKILERTTMDAMVKVDRTMTLETLLRKQLHTSGKVVVAERCLNGQKALQYSMKQFDLAETCISSIDVMPGDQLQRLRDIDPKVFAAALPKRPRAAPRLTPYERARLGTPPRGCTTDGQSDPRDTFSNPSDIPTI